MGIIVVSTSCSSERSLLGGAPAEEHWQAWQVLETKTGRTVSSDEWLRHLAHNDIVYLGEEHHNRHHIDAAVKMLTALMTAGVQPAIGMEMFGWDGQPALDEYLGSRDSKKDTFLEQVRWKHNWGGPFEDYEPLVAFAREHHLAVRAMNPPKSFVRQVAAAGLARAREGAEWARWEMQNEEIVDDPAYRTRILDQLRRCHGGGTDEDYRTMYEASMVRDEGMAKTLAATIEALRRDASGPNRMIVSYTGGGHIQYNLPVPQRVARRLSSQIRQTTIYMLSFDHTRTEEVRNLLRNGIADYIWLTPVGQHGTPQRCR
jgi:uncharacterized iron-regulated protein